MFSWFSDSHPTKQKYTWGKLYRPRWWTMWSRKESKGLLYTRGCRRKFKYYTIVFFQNYIGFIWCLLEVFERQWWLLAGNLLVLFIHSWVFKVFSWFILWVFQCGHAFLLLYYNSVELCNSFLVLCFIAFAYYPSVDFLFEIASFRELRELFSGLYLSLAFCLNIIYFI